jgi:Tol biopolymer transport system component
VTKLLFSLSTTPVVRFPRTAGRPPGAAAPEGMRRPTHLRAPLTSPPAASRGRLALRYSRAFSLCRGGVLAASATILFVSFALCAPAAIVYESASEFLTSGDFNGDGFADVLVLDKFTGNARVGYANSNGALTWSAPLVTGVENATGCAVGRLLQTSRDAVAVTAAGQNRINLVDLSNTNTAGAPVIVTPNGLGPHTLVTLANPFGGAAPAYNYLLVASSLNNAPAERLDLLSISAGVATAAGQFAESGSFERGNALPLSVTPATFAAGLVRGTNDTLHVWQFTNTPSVIVALSNLPPSGDYVFGRFNGETLPRFLFYVPGQSNVTIRTFVQTNGGYAFGPPISVTVTEAIQRVFYTDIGADGSAIIQFGDGVQGLRLPGGSPVLTPPYRSGTGAAGNVFTGVVPLGNGRLVMLDSPTGSLASIHGQVVQFDGTNYTQLSSANLPTVTARGTRANLWLFQTEPFVNRQAGFVASLNAPDWSDTITGLPGSLSVRKESDGGTNSGLGNVVTNNLGAPPAGSAYALPNQYRDVISVFSYSSPDSAEPVTITISPPPGIYSGPIQISFSALNMSDKVLYRVSTQDTWHLFAAPFSITNDSTIQFYGTNSSSTTRSRLQLASYSLGNNGQPIPTLNLSDGTSTTNPPTPPAVTNIVQLSSVGTLFYGRRSAANNYTIWAINLDGSGDGFVTTGARPRVSRDGHYMAFLRDGAPLVTQGNAWVRDLSTGQETMLYSNTSYTIGYDWDLTRTNLVFDWNCWLWRIGVGNGGAASMLPLPSPDCFDDAPVVNPVDGRIAFQNLNGNTSISGLYVTTPDATSKQRLNLGGTLASWPAWSPNGQWLAFADGNNANTAFTGDGGTNLWVVHPDGTALSQISLFTDGISGFPHGALWSPSGTALVAAGNLFGTNGLWIIPLNANLTDCGGFPILLPTLPGDAIDFAGSIIVAPPAANPANLRIRRDTNSVVVYWSTNFVGYILQSKTNLSSSSSWLPVGGPYALAGINFEYREPLASLQPTKFFRLRFTGVSATAPTLFFRRETNAVVLYWQTSFAGFSLESATDLPPTGSWGPVSGPYPLVNGYFQYRDVTLGLGRRFYRLHWP